MLSASLFAAQPQSLGLITGTIATGVLAIIICSVLVVVTIFYWRNKNKYDEEDIPNEIRLNILLSFLFLFGGRGYVRRAGGDLPNRFTFS